MRKLKERFHRKHGIVSRIFSMVLALAMIVTMVPAIGGATTGCQCLGCRCYGR